MGKERGKEKKPSDPTVSVEAKSKTAQEKGTAPVGVAEEPLSRAAPLCRAQTVVLRDT